MSDIEMHYRFERYWEENASKDTWANKSVAFNIWQSRQAEIDGLTIKLNGANERAMSLLNHKNRMVDKMQAEIDELQAKYDELNNRATGIALDQMATAKLNYELQGRIDEATKLLSLIYEDSWWLDSIELRDVISKLKGNQDEK